MVFIVCLVLIVVSTTTCSAKYEFMCPSPEQWVLRAKTSCPNYDNYTCLYNEINKDFTEDCKGPREERKGSKANRNQDENFNRADCPAKRYQNFKFTSVGNSDCLLQKSDCNEEGQVKVDNGSTTSDVKCRCDNKCGFAPVANITDPYDCVPSEEDCSCYRKHCSKGEVLSKDFKCVSATDNQQQCLQIQVPKAASSFRSSNSFSSATLAAISVTVTTVIACIVCLLLRLPCIEPKIEILHSFLTSFINRCHTYDIIQHLENIRCLEGDKVVLSCTVNRKNLQAKWLKDSKKILSSGESNKNTSSEVFKISVDGKIHSLTFSAVKSEDGGKYCIKFKGRGPRSYGTLTVVEKILDEDVNYFRMLYFITNIAEPVVRSIFDKQFHPNQLKTTLIKKKSQIDGLKKDKHINRADFDLLYPRIIEFRVEIMIEQLNFSKDLEKKDSDKYKTLANQVKSAVSNLYTDVGGVQEVEVIQFQPGSVLVTLGLTSRQFYKEKVLEDKLKSALSGGMIIGQYHTSVEKFSFTFFRNINVPVSSKDFRMRLMLVLLKNLAEFAITDIFPGKEDKSVPADLSRIKFYGDKIKQNSEKKIEKIDFQIYYQGLKEVVQRLSGGQYEQACEDILNYQPSPKECQNFQCLDISSYDSKRNSVVSVDEFMFEQSLTMRARTAVRRIFDEKFPPHMLKGEIDKDERKKYIKELENNKEITKSQLECLLSDAPSSKALEIKTMMFLLRSTNIKETLIFKSIVYLCNLLSKTDFDVKAVKQAIKDVERHDFSQ